MPDKLTLKVPPQSIEAEEAVLGSLLIDKDAIIKVADLLSAVDFYAPANEKIYEVIQELYDKHQPIDLVSVTNRLKEEGKLKDVGGSAYVADLTNRVTTSSNIAHYASIVKSKKVLRDVIQASGQMAEAAFSSTDDIEDFLDDVEQKILSISQKSLPQNFMPLRDELHTAFERIEKMQHGGSNLRGIPTGFHDLDKMLSGLQKSDLVVLGARPSLGKTSLALDMARGAALAGVPVGIFSLEMSREQVIDRLISAESQVPLWKILTGRINDDEDFQMIQHALGRLSQVNIFIDDSPTLNVMEMRSMARRLQVDHGLGLLIVDYLQLIRPRRNIDNMVQQVTEISRGLKALARELKVPVLALSQLSRAIDQRDHKMPRLSDLRESGSIEQDADVVLFIYRKDRDKTDVAPEEQNMAQIIVAKHRNGPVGAIDLRFDPEKVSFRNLERRYEDLPPLE